MHRSTPWPVITLLNSSLLHSFSCLSGLSTLITTNKSFAEWSEVFPNAACVVALIDRLVHHAEIIALKGLSWRHKEAQERAATNARKRKSARSPA